jgi:hypothetical protein
MKVGGGSRIVEKSRERRSVKYSVIGCEVAVASIIISECAPRKAYNEKIQFA